jgi:FKBP-type peptidyl-prolyl cis-trans isomerase SlyD
MKVSGGSQVRLRYRLFDGEGELVEASEEARPLEYTHGSGEIPPGLESALEGRSAGDAVRVTLQPEEAFGPFDPGLIVSVPRSELPPDLELVPGEFLPVELEDAPEDLQGEELEFRIVEVAPDEVILDANHPLAGEAVTFELEVLSVSAGT